VFFWQPSPTQKLLRRLSVQIAFICHTMHRFRNCGAGPDAYRDLPRLLRDVGDGASTAMNVQLSLEETYADVAPTRLAGAKAAFVSITRGCNNMCSFCIVPFTRYEMLRARAALFEHQSAIFLSHALQLHSCDSSSRLCALAKCGAVKSYDSTNAI
jgi:hypothetical protein